jgi:phenylpropionate dioxygenase-like ring-hydroxylating dioxygenase large terminal subunit
VTDLFDPARYAGVRKPLLEAETLPPSCYFDPAFHEREKRALFTEGWILVGRIDRIQKKGDYFTVEYADVQLIVVRDLAGNPRAFANTCRHRGARLLDGAGNTRSIVCPYHSWTFALDGTLRGAAGMEQTVGFKLEDNGLHEVRVGVWAGFLFVCVDAGAPSLETWLGALPERLAMYRLDDMVQTRRKEFRVKCNWKLWVENYMEGYHVPTVHRSTISKFQKINFAEDPPANGQFHTIHEQHDGTLALLDGDAGFPPIEGLADHGEVARGSRFILVYPMAMIALTIDTMWTFECHPLGPEETLLVHTSCFPKSIVARPDFEQIAANYYKRQDIVVREDNDIAENQQRGLRSPFARSGRLSYKEKIVHQLDNWVLDRVLGTKPPPRLAAVR